MKDNARRFISGLVILCIGTMIFIPVTAYQASKITPIFEAGKVVGFHRLNVVVTFALITVAWIVIGAALLVMGELKQE